MAEWVAIVGSRGYRDERAVREYVDSLPDDTVIVTGGARGVDNREASAAHGQGDIASDEDAPRRPGQLDPTDDKRCLGI